MTDPGLLREGFAIYGSVYKGDLLKGDSFACFWIVNKMKWIGYARGAGLTV